MPTDRINDSRAFRDFLDAKLSEGGTPPTLDHAIGLWEHENSTEAERAETGDAIRQGLAERGKGVREGKRGQDCTSRIAHREAEKGSELHIETIWSLTPFLLQDCTSRRYWSLTPFLL